MTVRKPGLIERMQAHRWPDLRLWELETGFGDNNEYKEIADLVIGIDVCGTIPWPGKGEGAALGRRRQEYLDFVSGIDHSPATETVDGAICGRRH